MMPQLKGKVAYHGSKKGTMIRENVMVEKGWVASSSHRRDYLFVQYDRHVGGGDRDFYEQLNHLGALLCLIDTD